MTAGPTTWASGCDLGALAEPHASAIWKPGDVDRDALVEHVLVGAEVGIERADVLPVALGDRAVRAAWPSASSRGKTSLEKSTGLSRSM